MTIAMYEELDLALIYNILHQLIELQILDQERKEFGAIGSGRVVSDLGGQSLMQVVHSPARSKNVNI